MKKLFYIANIRIPTEKAHGIQIMKMCEAFANQGIEVSLVVPRRFNKIKDDPFEYYKVKKNFKIIKLPVLDLVRFGKIGFWVEALSFAESVFWFSLFKKDAVFFTRDEIIAFYLSNIGKKVVWEGHMGHTNWFIKELIRRRIPMVTITKGLKDLYVSTGGDPNKILVSSDAVDVDQFRLSISKEDARKKVGLPGDKKIVLYAGHLYEYTGVSNLLGSFKDVNPSVLCVVVGGTETDIIRLKNKCGDFDNVKIIGKKPHKEIPLYLKSADILVMPYSGKTEITKKFMSPLKLFEYMASGRPIIASDLPSIREILNEEISFFFEPDNPKNLADTINRALNDYENSEKIAQKALTESKKYSWDKRVLDISIFCEK